MYSNEVNPLYDLSQFFFLLFCFFHFQDCLTCTDSDDWMRVLAPALNIGIGVTFHPASVLSLDELYCPGL